MEDARSLRFAEAVQDLRAVARGQGWRVPSFRSPPGVPGVMRTLRRRPDGSFVVAVVLHDRPWADVLADLVEGVVAANAMRGGEAKRCRAALWSACGAKEVMPHALPDAA